MRILITGASGFIGSHLTDAALSGGHEVIALCRSGKLSAKIKKNIYEWSFGEPLPARALDGAECAIHLAHDFNGVSGARSTFSSTLWAMEEMRARGVKRQFFFSSYSASPDADSLYGTTKYALEQEFKDNSDVIIVRPGLVLGSGGIYGRIKKCAQLLPLIPLPDGGAGKVPVIEIEELCKQVIRHATAVECPKELKLFEPQLKSLRELVLEAASGKNRTPLILPVPSKIVMGLLRMAETLGLPLPVKSDNLKGFLANQNSCHKTSLKDG